MSGDLDFDLDLDFNFDLDFNLDPARPGFLVTLYR